MTAYTIYCGAKPVSRTYRDMASTLVELASLESKEIARTRHLPPIDRPEVEKVYRIVQG
jgi:hypothetical protein